MIDFAATEVLAPKIGASQRLSATTLLSLAIHLVALLGIGFAARGAAPVVPTLDVIMSTTRTALSPKQAAFLAQVNNEGGGEHDKTSKPSAPQSGVALTETDGLATKTLRAQSPAPQPPPETRVIAGRDDTYRVPSARETQTRAVQATATGDRRVDFDMDVARLAAEIHQQSDNYAKRPKVKFISAATREFVFATYLRQWADRVERVGNLNYPDEARRRQLKGSVLLSVGIRKNGSVESINVVRSSGKKILDDAAVRIARLAEPYPPIPRTSEELDLLMVVRTWDFQPEGTVTSH
ncbi:energy transducer TonB [Lysobacter sp. HDW10]|uniref:energy transducer TonB n=1 Tax=Lysobacter sp. HDW10 TaxID=2714936 RepID=UPI0014078C49|nr:energy transducer TonB [Lysobacter sp. HDW10]QIK81168.1 energy transducer TonB [Lysobacter sp. HDW10]